MKAKVFIPKMPKGYKFTKDDISLDLFNELNLVIADTEDGDVKPPDYVSHKEIKKLLTDKICQEYANESFEKIYMVDEDDQLDNEHLLRLKFLKKLKLITKSVYEECTSMYE